MRVHYASGDRGPSYYCSRSHKVANAKSCLRFNGKLLEQHVSAQILNAVEPMAIEAAVLAQERLDETTHQQLEALGYALEQARYEAKRVERQHDATEPEYHLVIHTLNERWQRALHRVEVLSGQYEQARASQTPLAESEKARLFELANDLQQVWDHPATSGQLKTRWVRQLIKEVWVKALDATRLRATIHWHGGVHTEFEFCCRRRKSRTETVKEQEQVIELIEKLASVCADDQIARVLNRAKITDLKLRSWSAYGVTALRKRNKIAAFSPEQYQQRGLVNLQQAAEVLGASLASVFQLIQSGLIKAHQIIECAPWEIERAELDKPTVRRAIAALKHRREIPFHENQQELNL
jgi:hypothetical protein